MKKLIFGIIITFLIMLVPFSALAQGYGGYEKNAVVTFDNLKIVSFTKRYGKEEIKQIYKELIANFHGDEFKYLSAIYLYPDSPEGIAGNYYEDINIDSNGKYVIGKNSYIELFNMDINTPKEIAPILSHEYGHHYTISNMIAYENKYYNRWNESEYAKIRKLKDYPVNYGEINEVYTHAWDIAEIVANDYVQLLGSKNARASWDYKDAEEAIAGNIIDEYSPMAYNMKPQENMDMPIATDVEGLFEYMLTIGGYTGELVGLEKKPVILGIKSEDEFLNKKYTISFSKGISKYNTALEYTIVMYPIENKFLPVGIKTVSDGENLNAVFGTVTKKLSDGTMVGILDYYTGKYGFKVYAKDEMGHIFSSDEYIYDFGEDYFDTAKYYDEINKTNNKKRKDKTNNINAMASYVGVNNDTEIVSILDKTSNKYSEIGVLELKKDDYRCGKYLINNDNPYYIMQNIPINYSKKQQLAQNI